MNRNRSTGLRRVAVAGLVLAAGVLLGTGAAMADGRGGHPGGRPGGHSGGHSVGYPGHVSGHVGVGVYFPAWSFYYPYGPSWYSGWPYYGAPYYYGSPYYAYPPAVVPVPTSPPTYVEQPRQPQVESSQRYWYWCSDPAGYYPTVRECPGGWTPVAPQPARPQ